MRTFLKNKNAIRNSLVTLYVLIVLGFSATSRAQMSIMPIFENTKNIQIESYVGQMAMTLDGRSYLVVDEDYYFELKSNIDLSEFNGKMVSVDGYEVKHKVGPVVDVASLDPLPGNRNEATVAPLLIVFGISEISE